MVGWLQHSSAHEKQQAADQFVDEVVHSLTSLNQQHNPPGLLQLGHHVLQRLRPDHLGSLGFILQEIVHLGHGAVESTDLSDGEHGASSDSLAKHSRDTKLIKRHIYRRYNS